VIIYRLPTVLNNALSVISAIFTQKSSISPTYDEYTTKFSSGLTQFIANGAVLISTNNPETPADFSTVDIQFSQQDINTFYEQRVSKAYDIAGVPLASGVTSSGGDTGKARLLGGGWENAYTIIKGDIIGCEKTDYQLLKQLIAVCHTVPQTKVNELTASQIEIHYNINPNDDILSKTQSAVNLYNIGMPEELILKYINLSLDPQEL
jgi:hypothetical protein